MKQDKKMIIEQQVASLKLSQKLKELGVPQESLFVWSNDEERPDVDYYVRMKIAIDMLQRRDVEVLDWCSAFTVAELGEMLPEDYITITKRGGSMWRGQKTGKDYKLISEEKTEADARAKMLIHLLENNLIKL